MRILIADDDPVFLEFTESVLGRRRDQKVVIVRDGQEALEMALSDPPQALFLNTSMPRVSGTEICRLVRAQSADPDIYVAMLSATGGPAALAECLDAGADDLITKPVPPDVFVARVELARQRSPEAAAGVLRMHQALWRAQAQGSGELVVRSDRISARVLFYEGRAAWTHLSDHPYPFLRTLATDLELEEDVVYGVIEECRRTGARLTDTIMRWGLVDSERLRAGIRRWMSSTLATIVRLPRARTLFLPQHRAYADNLLFSLEELGIPNILSPALPPLSATKDALALASTNPWTRAFVRLPQEPSGLSAMLDQCIALEGVIGVAALARNTGYCLGLRGAQLDADAAWAHIHSLNTMMRLGAVEDSVVSTDRHFHLARPVPQHDDVFLYVVVDASATALAMARIRLQRLTVRPALSSGDARWSE